MKTRFFHTLLDNYYQAARKRMECHLGQLESVQRAKLAQIIKTLAKTHRWKDLSPTASYEELEPMLPLVSYSDLKNDIEKQKSTGQQVISPHVVRVEPTSGSTEQRKWIPYSKEFLREINKAAAVWLGDIYHRYPQIKKGRHYWSLSWLPQELREYTDNNDVELFSFFERWILQNTMLMPSGLAKVASFEAAWWATLLYLASAQDLSLVSVWSPTYWLKITEDIKTHWSLIQECLTSGTWGKYEKQLSEVLGPAPWRREVSLKVEDKDFFLRLWPQLVLISCWGSASSKVWYEKIQAQFPKVSLQEKGLWATEGVVSFPFKEKIILAFESHFFEFKDLDTDEILPAWKLQVDKVYQPILWTSSGLLRYPLQDRIKVSGFMEKIPCLEFLGRLQSIDMVGEKMDAAWLASIFQEFPQWQALTLIAVRSPKPRYILCQQSKIPADIESVLCRWHHYKLARELGQLEAAECYYIENIFELWEKTKQSSVAGQNKIEILREIDFFNFMAGSKNLS